MFVALAAVFLAGCQSNPEPPPFESASDASPTATASPSDAAPTLPPEAKGTSQASAKAFVRHWVEVLNYAGPAGDGEALRRVSDRSCAACGAIADFINTAEAGGGEIRGRGWSIRAVEVIAFTRGETAVIDVEAMVAPQKVRTSANDAFKSYPGGQRLKTFWLGQQGNTWTVTRLDQPE